MLFSYSKPKISPYSKLRLRFKVLFELKFTENYIVNVFTGTQHSPQKWEFYYAYIYAAWGRRPFTFQTMNSVRSSSLDFKLLSCKDGIRKIEFVASNHG